MVQSYRFIDNTSYDAADFAETFYQLQGINFVLPHGGLLEVTSSGSGDASVNVATGIAQIFGIYYENDEVVSFTLDAQGGGNNRLDRIVLRRSTVAQTARLVLIKGVAAVAPTLPALTVNDMALFYIWVSGGFGAASTVADTDIHDERIFYQPAPLQDSNPIENLIANPEYLAWSFLANFGPEQWYSSLGVGSTINAVATIGSNTRRGRAVGLNFDNTGNYFGQYLGLSPDPDNPTATPYTIAGTIKLTSGPLTLTIGKTPAVTTMKTRIFRRTGTYNFVVRGTLDFTTPSAYRILWTTGVGTTAVFTLGPHICTKGYVAGPFGVKKEIIKFNHEGTDGGWNASVKATGTYTVDPSATFGFAITRDITAVLGRLIATDDNSALAGAGCNIRAFNHEAGTGLGGYINLQRDTNSSTREDQMIVGLARDATPSFRIGVNAQGNFAVTLKLLGIST